MAAGLSDRNRRLAQHGGNELPTLLQWSALLLPGALPCFRRRIVRSASTVGEQLFNGHVPVVWVHPVLQLRKHVGNGDIPSQRALFSQLGNEGGSHGLGAGTDVRHVTDGDGGWIANFTNPNGRAIAYLSTIHRHHGKCGQILRGGDRRFLVSEVTRAFLCVAQPSSSSFA